MEKLPFWTAKQTINWVKTLPAEWKEIFASYVPYRGWVSRIYKELENRQTVPHSKEKANNPVNTMGSTDNSPKRNYKWPLNVSVHPHWTSEKWHTTILRVHLAPVGMVVIEKTTKTMARKWKEGALLCCWRGCKPAQFLRKPVWFSNTLRYSPKWLNINGL